MINTTFLQIVLLILLLHLSTAHGDMCVVNPEGTGDFSTIQAAVNAVSTQGIHQLKTGYTTGILDGQKWYPNAARSDMGAFGGPGKWRWVH